MNLETADGSKVDCARARFVGRFCINRVTHFKYDARAGKREISPLAERAALRALKEGARAPKEGAYGVTTTY